MKIYKNIKAKSIKGIKCERVKRENFIVLEFTSK